MDHQVLVIILSFNSTEDGCNLSDLVFLIALVEMEGSYYHCLSSIEIASHKSSSIRVPLWEYGISFSTLFNHYKYPSAFGDYVVFLLGVVIENNSIIDMEGSCFIMFRERSFEYQT